MTRTAIAILTLFAPVLARGQDVVEPRSGVHFAERIDDMSLLGVGLRTKTFLKVRVYAVGLYVSDSALQGRLASHKAALTSPAFYNELVTSDFDKEIVLKFVRSVTADQIQGAFREALTRADAGRVQTFVSFFGSIETGQECHLLVKGGTLEVTVSGQTRPPIADAAFAAAVTGIWLGEKPIQEDIKAGLVARAAGLIK